MDILYLIAYAGKGGTEKYVAERMDAYTRGGDTCRLVYDTAGPLSEDCRKRGWPVYRLDMRPSRVLAAARELAALCRENGVEIIHAQYPRENVIAVLAAELCPGIRVFFTSHLSISQGPMWRLVNRLITPRDAAVIAVCTQGEELLRRNGVCREKICVIFNGVEPLNSLPPRESFRKEFRISPDTVLFLTMVRYAPEKGLEFLLQSLVELKKRSDKSFCCVIAGDGAEFEMISRRITEYHLERQVIQTGYRPDRERLLAAADVYVSSALYNEAMSYAILEAMSAGLPLAVTEVGGGPDLAEDCGFTAAPGDVEAMAENLSVLLEEDELRASLGGKARKRAKELFSLRDSLDKLHRLYETGMVGQQKTLAIHKKRDILSKVAESAQKRN